MKVQYETTIELAKEVSNKTSCTAEEITVVLNTLMDMGYSIIPSIKREDFEY